MTHSTKMLENLETYIQKGMEAWEIPGLAVAIVKDDDVVFAKGFGVCELGGKDLVDEHTVFAIGSNTKAFTATALGLLVQEGKLSWDDAVVKHLPGFQMNDPYVTRAITIRDLLCHRAGLPTWGGDVVAYGSIYTRDEIIHRIRYIQPAFSFRGGYGYSNMMFVTAGQIIPALTGLSWDDFIKVRIFEPLGMTRSSTSVSDLEGLSNVAKPHEEIGGAIRSLPYRNIDNLGPAGAINSTVQDMSQWLRLQLGNGTFVGKRIVDESIIEETHTPHTPIRIPPSIRELTPSCHFVAYGLGWRLMDYQGRLIVRHEGGIDGMFSLVRLLPEERLGIVILTNKLPQNFVPALFYHILDAYLDSPSKDWNKILLEQDKQFAAEMAEQKRQTQEARVKGTQPTLSLNQYAGIYNNQLYGNATITIQDDQLVLHLSAHPDITGALEHWHYDTFLCMWSDAVFDRSLVPFILDGQGHVERFRLKVREDMIDPLEYVFDKIQDKQNK
jgi:CubicO group peptidase (beta-lactamase class C family)